MILFPGFERRQIAVSDTTINLVTAGRGPALLLLHGFPQTHTLWHAVAPRLAKHFTVVAPDLRGYGDSGQPKSTPDHAAHSKRAMARDMLEVMTGLGHRRFMVAGHDRGGRVTHRLILDHGDCVQRAAVLDICPTLTTFEHMTTGLAFAYYHWFFLSQPADLPERLIGADPDYYLMKKITNWSSGFSQFHPDALAEYRRCYSKPAVIHASCEDYRAAATIDLEHDRADLGRKVEVPLLVLWGEKATMHKHFDVLQTWRERAEDVRGRALPCGHYLPEEQPDALYEEFMMFFGAKE